jgi:Na+-transporting NADH:ubiquinone oxidoreductase subunit B
MLKNLLKGPLDALEKAAHKKGSFLNKQWRGIEAFDTFARTPKTVTAGRVHLRDGLDSKRLMSVVIFALLPCVLFGMYNIGYQKLSNISASTFPLTGLDLNLLNIMVHGAWHLLPIIIVTYVVGLSIEFGFAVVRDHEVNEGFLVTGMLIPLTMPPDIPLWMVAVGTAFGVIFAKELFGGTGYNFLNPALTARAFIFFSYPTEISGEVWIAVQKGKDTLIDGFSGATPLGIAAVAPVGTELVPELEKAGFNLQNMFTGLIPGSAGETSMIAIGIGALILLVTKVGSWRVMLSTFIGGYFMAVLFELLAGDQSIAFLSLPAHYHLVMGGFAFGAVFMTTDPVSAAATNTGKWIYGFLIGVLAIIIRVSNPAYPEGMMLAILFMNVFAPLIDHYVIKANIKRRLARA